MFGWHHSLNKALHLLMMQLHFIHSKCFKRHSLRFEPPEGVDLFTQHADIEKYQHLLGGILKQYYFFLYNVIM